MLLGKFSGCEILGCEILGIFYLLFDPYNEGAQLNLFTKVALVLFPLQNFF